MVLKNLKQITVYKVRTLWCYIRMGNKKYVSQVYPNRQLTGRRFAFFSIALLRKSIIQVNGKYGTSTCQFSSSALQN